MSISAPDDDAPAPDEADEANAPSPTRALACATPPLITAPMSVERAPTAASGPAVFLVVANDVLRKTAARPGSKLLRSVNKDPGIACLGCAWPSPKRPRRYEVCESGARTMIAAADRRCADSRLFSTYTIPELAGRSDQWLASQGRLTTPMVRRPDARGYTPISWTEATEMIATALAGLPAPDRALFYSSPRLSNEACFALSMFARELGTNNLASSSRLCHTASRVALGSVLGSWRNPVDPSDFAAAEAIFVFGQNPGSNHPRMLETLRDAKQRGATIVSINPLHEVGFKRLRDPRRVNEWFGEGTAIADHHVAVRVGGDLALIQALSKACIEKYEVDEDFIAAHTEGFPALEQQLRALSWDELVERSGVELAQIHTLADIYAESRATIACWGVGLTQHRHGVATLEQLLAWLLLRANVGKPGAGPFAALGHSNTAGAWTMGLDPDPALLDVERFTAGTGIEVPPTPGLELPAALAAMARGELDLLIGVGGNLLSASPATEDVAAGLRKLELSVHLATRLNRSHLITGRQALLLPCLARHEHGAEGPGHWTSHEDACGRVVASSPQEQGREHTRSEVDVLAEVAAQLWPDSPRRWPELASSPATLRTRIAASIPVAKGFANGLTPGRSLQLPRPTRERSFPTPSGKAQLRLATAAPLPSLPNEGLWLTTIRSHDQHNSLIYSAGDRERGLAGYRRVLLMNLGDIQRLELDPYDQVDITSHFEGRERCSPRWLIVPHHLREGCVAAYWPEANELVPPDDLDPHSRTPSLKSIAVTLRPAASRA